MNWNAGISGGTFSSSTAAHPTGSFCWTPGPADSGWHSFTVNVANTNCPIAGTNTYAYNIFVVTTAVSLPASIYSLSTPRTCPGDSVLLQLKGDLTGVISPSANLYWLNTETAVLKPDTTTAYSIIVSSPCGGKKDTSSFTIAVGPAASDSLARSICQGDTFYVGTHAHTQTGTYFDTLSSSVGCDSFVTLRLTVKPLPVVTFALDSLDALHDLFDSDVWGYPCYPSSFLLTGGNPTSGTYSGIGVYNNIFYPDSVFMMNIQRDTLTYAYTDSNSCNSVADAIIFLTYCEAIQQTNATALFTLYPNPTDDYVIIDFNPGYTGATLILKDITGREILQTKLSTAPQQLPTGNLPAGVYIVTINGNGQTGAKLLIKN
jgi:hypothetical protein